MVEDRYSAIACVLVLHDAAGAVSPSRHHNNRVAFVEEWDADLVHPVAVLHVGELWIFVPEGCYPVGDDRSESKVHHVLADYFGGVNVGLDFFSGGGCVLSCDVANHFFLLDRFSLLWSAAWDLLQCSRFSQLCSGSCSPWTSSAPHHRQNFGSVTYLS
jgi:hypothetical protein